MAAVALLLAGRVGAAERSPLATSPRYAGTPFMQTWDPSSYGASVDNFCVVQHPATGLIYVGNGSGVLEFDGARWRLISPPAGEGEVTSLCIDHRGRVWGGYRGSVLRLEPDARGELRALSMHPRLPAGFQAQNFASPVVATTRGVFTCDRKSLILFGDDEGPAQSWRIAEGAADVTRLWQIDDEPYVQLSAPDNRVFRLRRNRLEEVPRLTGPVLAAHAERDGTWQLATTRGIQWWNGTAILRERRPLDDDEALQSVFLADGRIVLGTVNRGLIVCDREGRVLQMLSRPEGLFSFQVRGLATDREGGVWAVQPGGIVRLQLDSPYARHGPTQGLEGSAVYFVRHRGELYVGGSEGVFRRDRAGQFSALPKLAGQIIGLVSHDDWLFALTTEQLFALGPEPGATVRKLDSRIYWGLQPLAGAPGWYAHGNDGGLHWSHFVGDQWTSAGPLEAAKVSPTVRFEGPPGVVWAWARAAEGGVAWRVDFRGGLRANAPVQVFGAAAGMPDGPQEMFLFGDQVVARVYGELRRFDEPGGRFVPETRITGLNGYPVARAQLTSSGTLWLQAGEPTREVRRVVPEATDPADPRKVTRWRAEPVAGEALRYLAARSFFADEDAQTLWLSARDTLISTDLTWRPTRSNPPPVAVVRRIETDAGYLVAANDAAGAATLPSALPSEHTNLRIMFAAPTYAADEAGVIHTEYRTRLEGLERAWTPWSRQTERSLSNLPWRDFTFRVQARDDQGRTGPEASVAFSIPPPWWATRWAWAAYSVAGIAALLGIVRWRTRALRRKAEQLEAIIAARTREIAERNEQLAAKNTELARLHQLELDEKLAAQLAEEKARLEVLRYQLNPHFLYNSLNSIYGLLFGNPRDAGEMVLRLSEFCRATLTRPNDDLPTLGVEFAALRTYLDVEKVRWGENLQVEFDVATEAETFRVPPFLLLPLVENAIKHGGETTAGVLRLMIRAHYFALETSPGSPPAGRGIVIEIANTGEWLPPSRSRPRSTGIGLENLRQRLRRYFPDAHDFSTETRNGWIVARLRLTGTAVLNRSVPSADPGFKP